MLRCKLDAIAIVHTLRSDHLLAVNLGVTSHAGLPDDPDLASAEGLRVKTVHFNSALERNGNQDNSMLPQCNNYCAWTKVREIWAIQYKPPGKYSAMHEAKQIATLCSMVLVFRMLGFCSCMCVRETRPPFPLNCHAEAFASLAPNRFKWRLQRARERDNRRAAR